MPEITFNLPELGDSGNQEATVSFILADPEERLREGDAIIEMSTDKAVFEVPCPCDAIVREIFVKEDQLVKVGDPICLLEVD